MTPSTPAHEPRLIIRLVNCPSSFGASWAYDQIAWWVQQHDPAVGSTCFFSRQKLNASAKKTKSGFTFTFEEQDDA